MKFFLIKLFNKTPLFLMFCLVLLGFSNAFAANSTPADLANKHNSELVKLEPSLNPEKVSVGVYLNDVQNVDLKLHNYMLDFYVWFRWKNPDLNPAETMEFVNHSESWSTMQVNGYEKPEKLDDGSFYQVVHVQGKMSKKMDLRNYPFDNQSITLVIEDRVADISQLQYVAAEASSNASLKLPGFLYSPMTLVSTDYTHQTTFGDPRSKTASTYSRLVLDLPIQRPIVNAFTKNLLPIFLVVTCCSLAFLLHPTLVDSRFQIAIVSLLSIVALQITSSQDLPTIEYMTLLDKLYVVAYFYCIAVVGNLTISTKIAHIHDDGLCDSKAIDAATKFDRIAGITMFVVYFALTSWVMSPLFT
jgi:hypothetical protein